VPNWVWTGLGACEIHVAGRHPPSFLHTDRLRPWGDTMLATLAGRRPVDEHLVVRCWTCSGYIYQVTWGLEPPADDDELVIEIW
jgi:hypothetical protein